MEVLIIDDDKLARKGLISLVPWEQCGFRVAGDVANGRLALEFLKTHPVSLAVVDLSMPVMDGLEFIRESRKLYPKLQYVVLSFHEDFDCVQNALRLGALDYISKLRMEEEDCAGVFQHIGKMMGSMGEKELKAPEDASFVPDGAGLTAEQFNQVLLEWQSCHWFYHRDLLEKQMSFLSQSSIGPRQLDRLMMTVSQEIERQLHFCFSAPFFSSVQEALDWLSGLYDSIYEKVDSVSDVSLLPVCALKAVKYVRAHLTEHLKMEEIAQMVHMSRSYFAINFKSITGSTFNTFVRHERIEMAKRLLTEGNTKISDLAEAVGYEDEKYFAHIFQKQVGVNCSEYLKRYSTMQLEGDNHPKT